MTIRFLEIDLFKGIAVICMVIFHIFYLWNQMNDYENPLFNTRDGILYFMAKVAQVIFLVSVGLNLAISYQKNITCNTEDNKLKNHDERKLLFFKKQIKRVFKISIGALIMTLTSYWAFPDKYVRFGILHFIAVAILLLSATANSISFNVIIIIQICILYTIRRCVSPCFSDNYSSITNFILGINNDKYSSIDHFTILKWLPFPAFGIILGNILYKNCKRRFSHKVQNDEINPHLKKLVTIGKYSFEIYAVHFFIIYAVLYNLKQLLERSKNINTLM